MAERGGGDDRDADVQNWIELGPALGPAVEEHTQVRQAVDHDHCDHQLRSLQQVERHIRS
jgi:hypothetical protein